MIYIRRTSDFNGMFQTIPIHEISTSICVFEWGVIRTKKVGKEITKPLKYMIVAALGGIKFQKSLSINIQSISIFGWVQGGCLIPTPLDCEFESPEPNQRVSERQGRASPSHHKIVVSIQSTYLKIRVGPREPFYSNVPGLWVWVARTEPESKLS